MTDKSRLFKKRGSVPDFNYVAETISDLKR